MKKPNLWRRLCYQWWWYWYGGTREERRLRHDEVYGLAVAALLAFLFLMVMTRR